MSYKLELGRECQVRTMEAVSINYFVVNAEEREIGSEKINGSGEEFDYCRKN